MPAAQSEGKVVICMNIKKKISGSPWVWPLLGILLLWIGISILNGNFEISTLGVNINCLLYTSGREFSRFQREQDYI